MFIQCRTIRNDKNTVRQSKTDTMGHTLKPITRVYNITGSHTPPNSSLILLSPSIAKPLSKGFYMAVSFPESTDISEEATWSRPSLSQARIHP